MTVRPQQSTSDHEVRPNHPVRADDPADPRRRGWPLAVSAAVVATAINLGLYGIGRLAGASLVLDPAVGPPNHQITALDVAWKTFLPLSLGMLVLLLARRRSDRWMVAVLVLGLLVALGTGAVPPFGAHDGLTAVLLASMHTVPGLVLAWTGLRLRRGAQRPQ